MVAEETFDVMFAVARMCRWTISAFLANVIVYFVNSGQMIPINSEMILGN